MITLGLRWSSSGDLYIFHISEIFARPNEKSFIARISPWNNPFAVHEKNSALYGSMSPRSTGFPYEVRESSKERKNNRVRKRTQKDSKYRMVKMSFLIMDSAQP